MSGKKGHSGRPNVSYPWILKQIQSRERTDECWVDWPWNACKPEGYPMATRLEGGRQISASILVLELDDRPKPSSGAYALHSCDETKCLNPSHLRWGNHAENMEDMKNRNRGKSGNHRGERSPLAKLNDLNVREMRRRYNSGEMQKDLALEFGISRMSASEAIRGKTWGHVK